MFVKNIIKKVLELTEDFDTLASIENGEELTEEKQATVKGFVNCLNLVRNEIAVEYFPNLKIEKVKSLNGRIDFSNLSNEVIEIISVKDGFGNSIKFDAFADHILVDASVAQIKYNASPETLDFNDEFSSPIPERVFAYGILKESFYIQTLYQDASAWDERFKNSLQALCRKKNETAIPRRRWF